MEHVSNKDISKLAKIIKDAIDNNILYNLEKEVEKMN